MGKLTGLYLAAGLALASCGNGQEQIAPVAFTTGGCIDYPAEDGYCSAVGLGGVNVFLFGDDVSESKLMARDQEVYDFMINLETAARTIASEDCIKKFKLLVCYGWFPPCSSGIPLKPCKSSCDTTWDVCKTAFDTAIALNLGGAIPQCDVETINSERAKFHSMFNHYFLGTEGEKVYEADTYDAVGLGKTIPDANCASIDGVVLTNVCKQKKCPEPLLYMQYPLLDNEDGKYPEFANPDDLEFCADTSSLDCDKCAQGCSMPCPYPLVFTDSENVLQNAAFFVPGVIAFFLNAIVFASETSKLQKQRKQTKKVTFSDRLVQSSASLALLLFFMETLPSLVFGSDVLCDGLEFQSINLNMDGHGWCTFGQLRHWVLIGLMATVACNLYKVSRQLGAAASMKKYNPSIVEKSFWVFFIFVLPAILAVIALLTRPNPRMHQSLAYRSGHWDGVDEDTSNYNLEEMEDWEIRKELATVNFTSTWHPNKLRGMYACQYFFGSIEQEMWLYIGPLVLLGLACAVLSLVLLKQVFKMNNGGNLSKNKSLFALAVNMLLFALAAIVLLIINLAVLGVYIPKAEAFGVELELWNNCLVSGINQKQLQSGSGSLGKVNTDTSLNATLATCGNPKTWAPQADLLVMLNLSQSLPALAFGLVFARPAIKQLRAAFKRGLSSVAPTSNASSAN